MYEVSEVNKHSDSTCHQSEPTEPVSKNHSHQANGFSHTIPNCWIKQKLLCRHCLNTTENI